MFKRKKLSRVEQQILDRKKKDKQKEKDKHKRLYTDTYTTQELDAIIQEHLSRLERVDIEHLRVDTIYLGTTLIYYYPIGQEYKTQVYSIKELKYIKRRISKLGYTTQIVNRYGDSLFEDTTYLRVIWFAE